MRLFVTEDERNGHGCRAVLCISWSRNDSRNVDFVLDEVCVHWRHCISMFGHRQVSRSFPFNANLFRACFNRQYLLGIF